MSHPQIIDAEFTDVEITVVPTHRKVKATRVTRSTQIAVSSNDVEEVTRVFLGTTLMTAPFWMPPLLHWLF